MTAPTVTVYTRPRCSACDATKARLDQLGVPFDAVDVSEDLAVAQELVDAGFRAMPVVRVVWPTGEPDAWAGHQGTRLAELALEAGLS